MKTSRQTKNFRLPARFLSSSILFSSFLILGGERLICGCITHDASTFLLRLYLFSQNGGTVKGTEQCNKILSSSLASVQIGQYNERAG